MAQVFKANITPENCYVLYEKGMTIDEISKVLSCSKATVHRRLCENRKYRAVWETGSKRRLARLERYQQEYLAFDAQAPDKQDYWYKKAIEEHMRSFRY